MTADLNPKSYDNARRQFVEIYGAALSLNTVLMVVSGVFALLSIGLLVLNVRTQAQAASLKPIVVRIDEVGRAEAVAYDAATWTPRAPELRYFLTRFVVLHFGRLRATLQRDYPDSLFFLDPALVDATISANEQTRVLETFLANPSTDEIDIVVNNVTFPELSTPPFKASVDFVKIAIAPGTRLERSRETYVAHLDFVVQDRVPNAYIPVNPLGLQIKHFRVDQAF